MTKKMGMTDSFHFGKHAGRTVWKVIAEDLSYVCWLREQNRKSDSREHTFDFETNRLIDLEITKNKSVSKAFKLWNLEDSSEADTHMAKVKAALIQIGVMTDALDVKASVLEIECARTDGWGSW